MAYNAKEIEEN